VRRIDRDLTEGKLTRNIWHLALPLMVTSALQDLFNIVDMIFVGRLGPAAIAAVSVSGILMGVVRMLAIGISTGTVAMVSRFIGQKDQLAAVNVMFHSVILSLIGSILIGIVGYYFAGPLLVALGAAAEVVPPGLAYLRIMCLGGLTIFLTMTLSAGLRGFGDAVTPMVALGVASVLNVLLDPLLIFGIGPFPRLGVAGSAAATVIARGVASVMLLYSLLRAGRLRLAGVRFDINMMGRVVRIGSFSALRMLSMNLSRIVLVRFVAAFGTMAVAAFGIGMRLRLFVLMPGMGFGDAAGVLVGQNLGASKPQRAVRSSWIAVVFFACFISVIGLAFILFPQAIIGIFNTHPEVLSLGSRFLRIFALCFLFIDLSVVLGRAQEGSGDTISPMLITGLSLVIVGLPLAWLFSRLWGTTGIWISISATEALQGAMMALWFQAGRWKKRRI
jgi:putative MATE family efflux protein